MAYQQKGNFKVFVYLGAIVDPNPPAQATNLDFSQAVNAQYLSLFTFGLIGKATNTPAPGGGSALDFSDPANSQYLALLAYGAISK